MKNVINHSATLTVFNANIAPLKRRLASILLTAGLLACMSAANAYDLQANTIYANATGGIYKIDLDTNSATQVATTNASLSNIQDIAFDGSTLYGINLHWQLLKLEPSQNETVAINEASSFSLQFQGLEARGGVLYGAELRLLVTIDKETANTESPGAGASSYGLGVGELVTDLAFSEDGTLYASVSFPGISFAFLGTIDPSTGALNIIGNTSVEAVTALTVKDGVIYAMDIFGNLYTLNQVSGFGTKIAAAVLPGVRGMDTSPISLATQGNVDNTGGGSSGGLSLWLLMLVTIVSLLRRIR